MDYEKFDAWFCHTSGVFAGKMHYSTYDFIWLGISY